MERRSFETPLGEIWLWGDAKAFDTTPTAIVTLTGAFAPPDALRVLAKLVPETPMLFGDIPGNHSPALSHQSVGAFASAYSAAISALARPVVLCGSSLGATVALGVRAPNVQSVLALEPVLRSEAASPLWSGFRGALVDNPDDVGLRDTLWNVFGVRLGATEARDYSPVLDGVSRPAWVLAGVNAGGVPSLLSAQDRRVLKAHPLVEFRTVLGVGHDIGAGATGLIVQILRDLVSARRPDGEAPLSPAGDLDPSPRP